MRCSPHTGRIERRSGLLAIQAARQVWAAAFASACKHDGILADARFAAFAQDNPFVPFVDKACAEYESRIAQYQAGGYVGLELRRGAPDTGKIARGCLKSKGAVQRSAAPSTERIPCDGAEVWDL